MAPGGWRGWNPTYTKPAIDYALPLAEHYETTSDLAAMCLEAMRDQAATITALESELVSLRKVFAYNEHRRETNEAALWSTIHALQRKLAEAQNRKSADAEPAED